MMQKIDNVAKIASKSPNTSPFVKMSKSDFSVRL